MKEKLGPSTAVTALWRGIEVAFQLMDCEKCTSGMIIRYAKKTDEEHPDIVPEIIKLSDIRKSSIPKYMIENFVLATKIAA